MKKNIQNLFCFIATTLILTGCNTVSNTSNSSQLAAGAPKPANVPITNTAFWQGNSGTLWNKLQYISLNDLNTTHLSDPMQREWVDLAAISKRDSTDTSKLVSDLMAWRASNPKHPGNSLFPSNDALTKLVSDGQPKHIAVLLPLTGPLGKQGQVVRDGFLNSFYSAHSKQAISFYNTNSNDNISVQYQKALSDGADFIIGPLTKPQVKSLMNQGSFQTATLALNYSDSGSSLKNFYQFGLAPQDEAVQLADKAHQNGYSHALIIASQNEWGQKVVKSLSSRFQSDGGKIQDVLYVTPKTDLTQQVANLLHVTPAKQGMNTIRNQQDKNNIQQTMQKQRRQDFDVIFLVTNSQTAKVVAPLLKFYYVNNVPLFATSSISAGKQLPNDIDLDGIQFCDTPWTMAGTETGPKANRLYAVGKDSYLLSENLNRLAMMPSFPIYGSTGALTLTADNQIFRRLPWTQIRHGQS